METTFDVRVTLEGPDSMTQHELQQNFLNWLPATPGKVSLNDARIVKGFVDEDDVPRKTPEESR